MDFHRIPRYLRNFRIMNSALFKSYMDANDFVRQNIYVEQKWGVRVV